MKLRGFHVVIIALITGLLGYYFGVNKVTYEWRNYKPQMSVVNKEPPSTIQHVDFTMFWTVWQKLNESYYDKKALDPQKLLNGAITGMVEGLEDPYTVYLPPVQNTDFKQGLAGKFEGIGAELGMSGKQIIVVSPLTGSPAEKAGIKPGDAIIKVNGQATFGWTLVQAVDKIRGPKGTDVEIAVVHKSASDAVTLNIKRDTIQVKSVEGWVKKVKDVDKINERVKKTSADASIVYLRLSQFGDNTNKEWVSIVNNLDLKIHNDPSVKGVILDLRNNPGGYLTDAKFIAGEFLKEGEVVVYQDNEVADRIPLAVDRKGLLLDLPIVVLINKGSASASEIVAGALRDHNRARLIGETSFGKGTIQQAEDLGNGAGLHVTIAKWLTPNGTWVHGKGLTPDISVGLDSKDQSHDTQLEKAIQELLK